MKHSYRFPTLLLSLLSFTAGVSAATYCGATITSSNGAHTATITCSSLGNNIYQFLFVSADEFTGYNAEGSNFYMNVNGVGGYQVSRNLSQEGNRLTAIIESSVVPNIYVGDFYVQYADGQAHFQIPTEADFSQVCTSSGDDNPPAFDPAANLALNKPAFAGFGTNPSETNDDNMSTRWGTSGAPKDYSADWWYVDLGAYYQLTHIDIFWEGAYSMDFVLQGAKDLPADVADDAAWRTLYSFSGTPKVGSTEADVNVYPVSGAARYVRIKSYENSLQNQWGMSIYEFRVYGSGLADDAPDVPVITSATVADATPQGVVLNIATDNVPVHEFLLSDKANGFKQRLTVSSDNTITLTGLSFCTEYTLTLIAIGDNYNQSEPFLMDPFTMPAGNLALGKECVAGFSEGEDYVAGNAVDGSAATRWSGYNAPEGQCWWQVDLGRAYNVENIRLCFENTLITDYTITASLDATEWTVVKEVHESPVANTFIDYPLTLQARFLRISSVQPAMSLYEFQVYGNCDEVEPPHDGYCAFFGAAGDGLIREGHQNKDIAFSEGYKLEMWHNETNNAIVVQLEYLDTDKEAANAIFLNYPELQFDRVDEYYLTTQDHHTFIGEVPMSGLSNREDGMIRFSVKLELPDGEMRLTLPEYYYLDGSGCAERTFIIYHHDDLPALPEQGALTQFAGGHILQPIQYKRMFRPGIWETLCLPFEVERVTVYDPTDDADYELYAQYTDAAGITQEGHFWLRTFDAQASSVKADDFQSNWQDIRAAVSAEALPQKYVPYIMMLPEGDYYADKYIIFHGKGYQTIDETYQVPALPADDYFSYSGNNTMMPWTLQSAYVIDAVGAYFESGATVTLQPFECAVNATQTTIRRLPRLGLNAQTDLTTGHVLPITHFEGEIYGAMGQLLGTFASLDAYEALLHRLPAGFYIVRMGTQVTKIYVEGAL